MARTASGRADSYSHAQCTTKAESRRWARLYAFALCKTAARPATRPAGQQPRQQPAPRTYTATPT
ncbi:hypothetical protein BM1_06394 [Bipolaris maydis]|nr:hypothetical protein BM1_06394 [Bipolaris maydis]